TRILWNGDRVRLCDEPHALRDRAWCNASYGPNHEKASTVMSAVKQTPQAERHRGKPARFNRGPGQSVARYVRGVIVRYALLLLVLIIAIGPFVWQVSTSLKGPLENVSAMPPQFIPQDP